MLQNIFESWGVRHIDKYLYGWNLFSKISVKHVATVASVLSFFIGFFLTLVTVVVDIYFIIDFSALLADLPLLINIILVNVVVIFIEFWLLFHVGFQATARYINEINTHSSTVTDETTVSLVRAVLELEEPDAEIFGLSPTRRRGRYHWLMPLLYKAKVLFSNLFAKIIIRKILGRGGTRVYIPLVSTVITGFWDAWVQKSVLKEVRFRLNTRMYALSLIQEIKDNNYSSDFTEAVIRIISVRIELYGSYNTNLIFLLREILSEDSDTAYSNLSDIAVMEKFFSKLTAAEREKTASIACFIVAFKRDFYSKEEKEFLGTFDIDSVELKSVKDHFNELGSALPISK